MQGLLLFPKHFRESEHKHRGFGLVQSATSDGECVLLLEATALEPCAILRGRLGNIEPDSTTARSIYTSLRQTASYRHRARVAGTHAYVVPVSGNAGRVVAIYYGTSTSEGVLWNWAKMVDQKAHLVSESSLVAEAWQDFSH